MDFTILKFTPFYAGLLVLFYVALSARIIRMRWRFKIGIGDGENKELKRAIRAHANFSEYVPLALFLLMMLELNHASDWLMNLLGTTLLAARFLQAMGLSKSAGTSTPRILGTVLTFAVLLVSAGLNIAVVY